MLNKKLTKTRILAAIFLIIAISVVLSWVYFMPREITEYVKVITVDQSGCMVETSDTFIIKITPCDAKPGETIIATYDEKIKERFRATTPP